MQKPVLVVTRRWPDEVEARMATVFDVRLNESDVPFSAAQLASAFREAEAVASTVSDRIDAAALGTDPLKTKIIANFGVGVDHIDLKAAAAHGLIVTNTPDVLDDCTADLAMALLLGIARRVVEGDTELRTHRWTGWRPTHMLGAKISGKTLGLVGFGRIGQAVARRAHFGFGMKILFHSRSASRASRASSAGVPAEYCASLDDLLTESDFVSLHCPSTPETRHLIGTAQFARMKHGAFLINTARGDVVDQTALIEALRRGEIAGAGLDVYDGEPNVAEALIGLPNTILLPHLGSATRETRIAMGMRVVDNLTAYFAGSLPKDILGPESR